MNTFHIASDFRNRLIISISALLILVGVAGYFLVMKSQHDIIEQQAKTVAEVVVKHAGAVRSVYSESIVDKLKTDGTGFADVNFHGISGAIPLPTQFLNDVADRASADSDDLYKYQAVSKWNLALGQGLTTDFLRSAWEELEQQDRNNPNEAIDWRASHQVLEKDGNQSLYYLKADPAVDESCVSCHNAYEVTPDIMARRTQQGVTPGKQ